jgi:LuxR family maltose regulon positive regulatory protein
MISLTDRLIAEKTIPARDFILETKLVVPGRQDVVVRQRLLDKLGWGKPHPLTLLCAPAGFGKTTLLAHWLRNHSMPVAWYSLDEGDNDPTRFLAHFITALQTIVPGFAVNIVNALKTTSPPSIKPLLPALINQMSRFSRDMLLVFDDYHLITEPIIHESLAHLLEHQLPRLSLAITSRSEPPLPLSRLRVRRSLNEIRETDLRFTEEEAAIFFNQVMGLQLSNDHISILEQRTEGWIAGLQLAAISLQGMDDATGFIRDFAGDDRYIMDYLTEEVLHRQPQQVKQFLLQTALLDRFSASLCEAVTGLEQSREILSALERANMFLVPLDNNRVWYRYHHLFADLLRRHLADDHRGSEAELHRRASLWFADNGLYPEAIKHAFNAGDFGGAADLIETCGYELFRQGGIKTLLDWCQKLPVEHMRGKPQRLLMYSWVLFVGGAKLHNSATDITPWLTEAEQLLEGADDKPEALAEKRRLSMQAEINVLRGFVALHQRQFQRAITLVELAQPNLSNENTLVQAGAALNLGVCYYATGQYELAEQAFHNALNLAQKDDSIVVIFPALKGLGQLYQIHGQLHKAHETYQQALTLVDDHQLYEMPDLGWTYMGLGELLHEWNDLQGAEHYLRKSISCIDQYSWDYLQALDYLYLAKLKLVQGNNGEAIELIAQTDGLDFSAPLFPICPPPNQLLVRAWLMLGDKAKVQRWVETNAPGSDDTPNAANETQYIVLARALLGLQCYDESFRLLARLLLVAEQGKRNGVVIEILMLQALVRQAQGNTKQALALLKRSLELAEPEQYIRLFVDEGAPMAALLKHFSTSPYAQKLLQLLDSTYGDSKPDASKALARLAEPLSQKELKTLHLLISGLSNKEIAAQLFVSPNTVKTHLRSIYDKMRVNNRTQAIARARELELI